MNITPITLGEYPDQRGAHRAIQRRCCELLGKLPKYNQGVAGMILLQHSHQSRHYHDLRHLAFMSGLVDQVAERIGIDGCDQDFLQWGVMLHDFVYDIGAQDNEERSEDFAKCLLKTLGYPRYEGLPWIIAATDPARQPIPEYDQFSTRRYEFWLHDIDLAALALPWEDFKYRNRDVIWEHGDPKDPRLIQKRAAFLNRMADKPLFWSPEFAHLEAPARENIKNTVIQALQA